MHYLIGILSTGETKTEAHDQAFAFADELVERGEFDYHADEGRTYKLTSALGRQMIEGALQANRAAFDLAITAVRQMLTEFTDDQIYQEKYGDEEREYYVSRHQFGVVSGYAHDCFLYGATAVWGDKINNDTDYQHATEGRENLWVTTMDFHN